MAGTVTKAQVSNQLAAVQSNSSGPSALVSAFTSFLSTATSVVPGLVSAAKSSNWSSAKSSMASVVQTPAFQSLSQTASSQEFNSIAIVGGVEGAAVIGGKALFGILTGTRDTSSFYSYEGAGVSVGAAEGGVAITGLYLSTDSPNYAGGTEFFAELAGDFVAGAAVVGFTSITGSKGLLILVSAGEEVEASVGVGYAWVNKI